MTPHGPAKAKINQWAWAGARTKEVAPESHYNTCSLSSFLHPHLFFHLLTPKQHTHSAVLSGPQQAQWLVLIEIIVRYEAEQPICQFSYSYAPRATGWCTDSTEISQGATCWKCILARWRGRNPQRTSRLIVTVCCVVSTATVIVELCFVWCAGPLRIALWVFRVRWHYKQRSRWLHLP